MIFDLIIGFLLSILSGLMGVLPTFTSPFCLTAGEGDCEGIMTKIGAYLGYVDRWLDVNLLITLMVWLVTALAVTGTVYIALWVYRNFPGKAS